MSVKSSVTVFRVLRHLAAEITREKIFRQLHQELPYQSTVETDSWTERKDKSIRIEQTIFVERESQRKIVLGKGGARKVSSRKFFPGYIFVQMVLDDETWHVIKDTPKITGFVGHSTNPPEVPMSEVEEIEQQMEEGALRPKPKVLFEVGEAIKVVDGPFQDFNGTVEEVKPEKGKVRVLISIFGRATPVELDFVQVEKA